MQIPHHVIVAVNQHVWIVERPIDRSRYHARLHAVLRMPQGRHLVAGNRKNYLRTISVPVDIADHKRKSLRDNHRPVGENNRTVAGIVGSASPQGKIRKTVCAFAFKTAGENHLALVRLMAEHSHIEIPLPENKLPVLDRIAMIAPDGIRRRVGPDACRRTGKRYRLVDDSPADRKPASVRQRNPSACSQSVFAKHRHPAACDINRSGEISAVIHIQRTGSFFADNIARKRIGGKNRIQPGFEIPFLVRGYLHRGRDFV